MKMEIVSAEPEHVWEIANAMQGSSRIEVDRISERNHLDRVEVIRRALARATSSWTGLIDGEIVFLAGVETKTFLSDTAYVWLITTEEVERHPLVFVRWSQELIKELQKRYRVIYGHIDPAFAKSVVWLKWLGFTIREADASGFRRFEMRTG